MLFELTGNYEIILPLMVTCVIASTMVHRILGESIYTLKLSARGISVRSHRDQVLLRSISVENAMTRDIATVAESMPLQEFLGVITRTTYSTYPVVDGAGKLSGLVSVASVRAILYEEGLSGLVVVKELAAPPTDTLMPDDDLETALKKLVSTDVDILPVVARDDATELVGLLSRRDVLRAYGKAVARTPGHAALHNG
jgi:CIC family chloride channel protein